MPAHITLVFGRPEAEADALVARVTAVAAQETPVAVSLSGTRIEVEEDTYLFLLVQKGRERLARLYRALNDDARADFAPHVTLGHFGNVEAARRAAVEAEGLRLSGVIERLQVENVLRGKLHRIATIPLGGTSS